MINSFIEKIKIIIFYLTNFLLQFNSRILKRPIVKDSIILNYIKGNGIEVGALHNKVHLPKGVSIKYVDRMNNRDLLKHYPELARLKLVDVDIVDNGETLTTIKDNSFDFVIAIHFIEHCQNPIGAIHNFIRVIKKGGIVYLTVPNKEYTFDKERKLTTFQHLIDEFEDKTILEMNKIKHFQEYVEKVDKISKPEKFKERLDYLVSIDYSIHYHVWDHESFLELLNNLKKQLDFYIEAYITQHPGDIVSILRKK